METVKPVVFYVMHETDTTIDAVVETFDLIVVNMPGGWKLGHVKKEKFDEFRDQHETFGIAYSRQAAELSFGFVDPDLEVITRDKCNRFYANPTSVHFCGLMLGWSTVSSDGLASSAFDWTSVDENCWRGDIDSVILNLLMPNTEGACGCGNNRSAVQALARYLITQRQHPVYTTDEHRTKALETYLYGEGELQDAMLFIAYLVDATGFTEHGGSVFHGWLTDTGVYLAFLVEEAALEYSKRVNAE